MTIYQLECFIAVAEELNFSAAAERLFTTQPAKVGGQAVLGRQT